MKGRPHVISAKVDDSIALKVQRHVHEQRRKQLDNPLALLQKPYTLSDFLYEAVLEKLGPEVAL